MWCDELNALWTFISENRKAGRIPESTTERVLLIFADRLDTATEDFERDIDDPATQAVVRQAVFEMRRALSKLHPELNDEIRRLGGGKGR